MPAVHRAGSVDDLMVLLCPDKGDRKEQPASGRALLLASTDARILEDVAAGVSTMKLASMLDLSRLAEPGMAPRVPLDLVEKTGDKT